MTAPAATPPGLAPLLDDVPLDEDMLEGEPAVIPPVVPALVEAQDMVNHPRHYTSHPSGVEAIDITEHMNFNMGNAVKYILRCDLKGDALSDLRKSVWYLEREIARRERMARGG